MMAAPAGAQTQSSDEPSPTDNAVGALSPASLARIRAALEAERSGRTVFGDPDDGWIVPPRPPVELAPGLGFIEGLGLFRDLTRGREPAPMGGPGHWAMMDQMQPREVSEVALADGMAIGTVSAFAAVGLPYVVRKVAGWFSGSGSRPALAAHPVLTSAQKAAVLEDMRANTGVGRCDSAPARPHRGAVAARAGRDRAAGRARGGRAFRSPRRPASGGGSRCLRLRRQRPLARCRHRARRQADERPPGPLVTPAGRPGRPASTLALGNLLSLANPTTA